MAITNPHHNPTTYISRCCKCEITFVPSILGERIDPSFVYCNNCKKEVSLLTDCMLVPVYEKLANGIYRKIDYTVATSIIQISRF